MEVSTTFKWRIDQFFTVAARDDPKKCLKGPIFELRNGVTFYLQFEPTATANDASQYHCSLFLMPNDLAGNQSVILEYRLWVENSDGKKLERKPKAINYEFTDLDGYGYVEFLTHSKLYGPMSDFVKDDLILICCEIQIIEPLTKIIPPIEMKLHKKLYSFYKQGSAETCTLQVGNRTFNVSKGVLMSHSNVFDRMLQLTTNTIRIEDTSPTVMEYFIKYLYLGQLHNLADVAKELFILADKYEVENLREECIESLSANLNKGNIFDRLQLAFVYNDAELKQNVLEYICDKSSEGNFRYIVKTREWKTLLIEDEKMAGEISDAVLDKI